MTNRGREKRKKGAQAWLYLDLQVAKALSRLDSALTKFLKYGSSLVAVGGGREASDQWCVSVEVEE